MSINSIILDIDGTLLASNDAHAEAFVRAMAKNDHPASFAAVRPLIGMGSDKLLPRAIGVEADSDLGKKIGKDKKEIFEHDFLSDLKPTPGARDLLLRFKKEGFGLVVGTSAGADEVKGLLKAAGVEDLIEEKTTKDDAAESKPAPDIIQAALKKAGEHPNESIMIGDTPYDVEASLRAGVQIIALRCGGWKDEDLAGAVAIYDNPADLLRHLSESTIFKSEQANSLKHRHARL